MIREYVEGHEFNGVKTAKDSSTHKTVWFVRGIIKCDGVKEYFCGWGRNVIEAQKHFDTYLNPNCICAHGNVEDCPIHKGAKC